MLVFDHAGSVMHYGLGSAMKTKLNTNGAVIRQRKGLSKVGRNTKAIFNFQLDILREELPRSRLTFKTKCLTHFSCWTSEQLDINKLKKMYCPSAGKR
jgi:hypothetical protein